jgi:hypothetical protein
VTKKDTIKLVKMYNVQFVEDYALITATSVSAIDEDDAVDKAIEMLADYYDIDVSGWMLNDVEELE